MRFARTTAPFFNAGSRPYSRIAGHSFHSVRPYLASSMLRAMTLSERIYRKLKRVFGKANQKMRETKKTTTNIIQVQAWMEHTHIYIFTCIPNTFYIYLDGKGNGDKYIPLGLGVAALTFISLCHTHTTLIDFSFSFSHSSFLLLFSSLLLSSLGLRVFSYGVLRHV
ncbi:hypothetical protein ACQKWADRAFT_216750 [Trichoderma austrokoningii]